MSDPKMLIVGGRLGRRGRQPRAGVVATARLEFRTTVKERADLMRIAQSEGKPVAEVIRDAVNEYVADFSERRVFLYGKN